MVLVISHNGSQTLVFYFSAASLIPPPGLLAFEREMSAPAVRNDITPSPNVPIEVCTCISLYTENIHQPKSSQFFSNAELKKSQVAKIKEAYLLDTGESRNFFATNS